MTWEPICRINRSSTAGEGVKAPIPPVFGPSSPARRRLWSCAAGSAANLSPSQKASTDTSRPQRRSSSRICSPADPKRRSTSMALTAAAASFGVSGTMTPLPAARPEALTTGTSGLEARWARAASGSPNTSAAAVGIPLSIRNPLQWTFEASSRAQAARGPKAATPAASSASTMPAASGSSGPMTARSTDSRRHSVTSPAMSPGEMPTFRVRRQEAVPGLPGATSSRSTCRERLSAQARACSRPPPPTTRTQLIAGGAPRRRAPSREPDRSSGSGRHPQHVSPPRPRRTGSWSPTRAARISRARTGRRR